MRSLRRRSKCVVCDWLLRVLFFILRNLQFDLVRCCRYADVVGVCESRAGGRKGARRCDQRVRCILSHLSIVVLVLESRPFSLGCCTRRLTYGLIFRACLFCVTHLSSIVFVRDSVSRTTTTTSSNVNTIAVRLYENYCAMESGEHSTTC
jgi:hypothetical protein